jgi:hypothetical protein
VTGLVVVEAISHKSTEQPITGTQVVQELALDFQCALARKGRAPFLLSGLPMFDDLCALHRALAQCLSLRHHPILNHWHSVLESILPTYETAFAEIRQALDWLDCIETILDIPLPTDQQPGPGGDAVALALAHCLGPLADLNGLSPWLLQFRDDLLAITERYWSGLFHCYDSVGLPRTNNSHESLYSQIKRQLRRQLGFSQVREPLLRRGAWIVLQTKAVSPTDLMNQLAQVSWENYFAERARYEARQTQCRRRYRWRHQRDAVLQQRLTDWSNALSDC